MGGKRTLNSEDKQANVKIEGEGKNYGTDNQAWIHTKKKIAEINFVGTPWRPSLDWQKIIGDRGIFIFLAFEKGLLIHKNELQFFKKYFYYIVLLLYCINFQFVQEEGLKKW